MRTRHVSIIATMIFVFTAIFTVFLVGVLSCMFPYRLRVSCSLAIKSFCVLLVLRSASLILRLAFQRLHSILQHKVFPRYSQFTMDADPPRRCIEFGRDGSESNIGALRIQCHSGRFHNIIF